VSLIVTGTGTGVGKTVTCAAIIARYGKKVPLAYWKPVATGASMERDSETVQRWCGKLATVLPETFLLEEPLSPHIAARKEGRSVDPKKIALDLVRHATEDTDRRLVIEGAGGLLVPLTDSGYLFADLVRDLHLPVVVVAANIVGAINHTLLTLEALRARGIEIAAVVLGGRDDFGNGEAISRFGKMDAVLPLARIPRPGPAGIARAARGFDAKGILFKYLK
jgi:dethiobiotin synthase